MQSQLWIIEYAKDATYSGFANSQAAPEVLANSSILGPYIVSNLFSIAVVVLAIKWPRLSRILFVAIFVAAGIFNAYMALSEPEAYLSYADMAVLSSYRSFITGFFSDHTQFFVLSIAFGQLLVAVLLSGDKNFLRFGVAGGITFFLAIIPLGLGAAFPASVILAIALLLMWQRSSTDTQHLSPFRTRRSDRR